MTRFCLVYIISTSKVFELALLFKLQESPIQVYVSFGSVLEFRPGTALELPI